ncbi:MAG: FAD-dependent oxidoreductase [Verrucomicrobiota bacterium]|jgi:monoamine oxidase
MALRIAQELKVVSPSLNVENDVLEYVIKRWKIGEVHVTPGFLSKYQKTLLARAGNIYFAGEYVSNFPTWGGAVWAGSKAAEEVLVAMTK